MRVRLVSDLHIDVNKSEDFGFLKETQDLLNNNINYAQAIQLINNDAPINLLWLTCICPF